MRYAAFLTAVLCCCANLFARGMTPPSSVTVTINTLTGPNETTRHNGTFVLTGTNNKGSAGTAWSYVYEDRPINPTTKWVITINSADEITVIAGSGQGPVGVWTANGDINLVTSANQVNPKNATNVVTIKANP